MLSTIIDQTTGTVTITQAIICTIASIILGLIIAFVHTKTSPSTQNKNFVIALAILPLLIQVVIMLVNGNLGTSVAILGAFSLVRFRSIPGNSKEITSIFLAMTIGLAVGTGYIIFAGIITIITCGLFVILPKLKIFSNTDDEKLLKILIPENLNYTTVFDDIFAKYTNKISLEKVKTTNMGSLYELTYRVSLKDDKNTKTLIDKLRVKNGNLKIALEQIDTNIEL